MAAPTTTANASVKRHCAFCLKESVNMLKCRGCKKRAYCSVDCQKKDWTSIGQSHKIWCKVDCCEEDFDWKVEEVPGKGLGLIALRDIPPLTRIMVEKAHTWNEAKDNPLLAGLFPGGGSLREKFEINSFQTQPHFDVIVCFRTSRVNHSCYGNADTWVLENNKTVILYSICHISKGEEICCDYKPLHKIEMTPSLPHLFVLARSLEIQRRWKIFCPSDCVCKSLLYLEVATQAQDLWAATLRYGVKGDFKKALNATRKLIQLSKDHPRLIGGDSILLNTTNAFKFALTSRDTRRVGMDYIQKFLHFLSLVEYPESQMSRSMSRCLNSVLDNGAAIKQLCHSQIVEFEFHRLQFLCLSKDGLPPSLFNLRHCSFCLSESANFFLCNGCHKRAYCSKGNLSTIL